MVPGPQRSRVTVMTEIQLVVNSEPYKVPVNHNESLLHLIRERLGLKGTKGGCNVGECGSCTVLVNGKAVRSCLLLAFQARGEKITTHNRGIGERRTITPLARGFHRAFRDDNVYHGIT
jgi:carbon-monoxide dehydrogenase small subunit